MQPEALIKDAASALTAVVLFAPGIVAMKTVDFWNSVEQRKAADYVYEIIAYSAVMYLLLAPYLLNLYYHPAWTQTPWFWPSLYACFLIVPALVGSIIAGVNTLLVNRTGRIFVGTSRTAWDWAFSNVANCGVVVELTDGGEIAGSFYDAAGVSAHPYDEAIYLDRLWQRDSSTGAFVSAVAGSKGCYVHGSRIRALHFYALPAEAATEHS